MQWWNEAARSLLQQLQYTDWQIVLKRRLLNLGQQSRDMLLLTGSTAEVKSALQEGVYVDVWDVGKRCKCGKQVEQCEALAHAAPQCIHSQGLQVDAGMRQASHAIPVPEYPQLPCNCGLSRL